MKFSLKILVALVLSCVAAFAQSGKPLVQSGNVTPTHVFCVTTNGIAQDCGTAAIPYATTFGTWGTGPTNCAWTALSTSGAAQQICLGGTTSGGAEIYVQHYGSASAKPLFLNLNGTLYQFPFTGMGAGNVVGPNSSVIGGVAVWANTLGTLLADGATQPSYFGSGYPWCDPRANGAKGDGSTDDSAAFAACITTLTAGGSSGIGGTIFVPPGDYCVNSGVDLTTPVTIQIIGTPKSILDACNHNVTVLKLDFSYDRAENLVLVGYNSILASMPTLNVTSNASNCDIENVRVTYGYNTVSMAGADCRVSHLTANNGYGTANLYVTAGAWFYDLKLDQSTLEGIGVSTPITAWAATTSYAANAVVVVGAFYLQTAAGGTSGGSTPTVPAYGSSVVDGTVTWQLYARGTFYGIQFDTLTAGTNNESHIFKADLSGPYTAGLAMTNTLSGNPPVEVKASGLITSGLNEDVYLDAGGAFDLNQSELGGCGRTGCAGIYASPSWEGDAVVHGGWIVTGQDGIHLAGGTNFEASGVTIAGNTTAIVIDANVSQAAFVGNNMGTSAIFGSNTNCLSIASGTSDYVIFANNNCGGTSISNSGSGAHNFIGLNDGSPLAVVNGGTGDSGTAWTNVALTAGSITCSSGTVTTATGALRYKTLGKTVFVEAEVNISSVGSCSTNFFISTPTSVRELFAMYGFDNTGSAGISVLLETSGHAVFVVSPAAHDYYFSGTYESS